jgi:plasmid stabilization system protein ParE
MFTIILLPSAKDDIKEAAYWYNSKQKGLGKRFTKEVRSKMEYIRENPKLIGVRYDNTRCAVLDVFPFMVHFSINEEEKTIIVSAVFHTSLNSERWENR